MTPTEKHRETAREVVMGWATSDGLVGLEDRVATALAKAEREGMKQGYLAGFKASGEGWNGEYPFEDRDPEDDEYWLKVRSRVLSEANSNSPDTLPVEEDSASGAVCSSPASLATYSPWTVKNGRRV